MDRKEELRKAYVSMLNSLVPELAPWIHERLAKGQNAFQTLAEFRICLAKEAPADVLNTLAQARTLGGPALPPDISSVHDSVLLAEVALRLRERQRQTKAGAPKDKPKSGPAFAPGIVAQMIPDTPPAGQEIDLTDSAP